MFSSTLWSQMLGKSGSFISKSLERYLHPTSFQNKFDIVCLMENGHERFKVIARPNGHNSIYMKNRCCCIGYDYQRQCTAVINYFIHIHLGERCVQNSHEHWRNSCKFISRNKEIFLFAKIYPVKFFWTSNSRSFIFSIFFYSYFLPTYK